MVSKEIVVFLTLGLACNGACFADGVIWKCGSICFDAHSKVTWIT